ncbi:MULTISPECIES: PepSY domain-containing protein [Streptomyces]|uniref:PepSY domain-containing protein n=1 Tax=Streptomyces TaxID=1883 RepID=UPI00103C109A|nr:MULTISPECIES: PepSY domain-containing protein [Streptomyces]MBT3075564.1 PepSY domain-containing protein [Streptomyces sp. COG21]MBT3079922.1 PepSY domain-containing protein [Streptomyces sp. COG20]MBT3089233.1 PepSY domain-containing protein [Streptomyces sp. CYG21]MBT3095660.1 PepSY domain-containing protein [Streptomyces sp. CBG30]MBT3106207.1 PepSY domain-containing protein [Streptomyces sp. COG19]
MKRNVTIAAITAAVLIGGTAAATVAFADDDGDRRPATTTQQPTTTGKDRDDRDDDRDDRNDNRSPATGTTTITLDQAVAALKSVPGTVTEAELDDDDDDHGGRTVWELDVHGSDKKWHDVTVDATTGKVLKTRQDDDNDDRDRHAPRSAPVTLNAAADAALKTAPGRITSIDLDDDGDDDDGRRGNVLRWDVDITGKDGKHHELKVDAKTGKVTVDRDDDGDDADDRNDDRDDD